MNNLFVADKYDVNIYKYSKSSLSKKSFEFKDKLQNGHYKIEPFSCPICNNSVEWILAGVSVEGFTWSICKKCGLFQMNKRLNPNNINEFYDSGEYQEICMGGLNDEIHFQLEHKIMSLYFLEEIKQIGIEISNVKILEIGCGSGGILLAFKEAGAKLVKGFDIDEYRINYGKRYLAEIEVANALENSVDLSNYNVILVSNVLEHLADPNAFLQGLYNKVSKDVKIIIDVPNLEGFYKYSNNPVDFFHIAHLWYFDPITLERLLNSMGFKVEHISNRGSAMTVTCSKSYEKIENSNNSLILSIASLSFAKMDHDPNSIIVKAKEKVNVIYHESEIMFNKLKK